MKKNKPVKNKEKLKGEHYIKALLETIRDPFLVLDSKLRVVAASDAFYHTFKVTKKKTLNKLIFKLGNGQWNITSLKKLLKKILPTKKIVKDYEVEHVFPTIGPKIMLVNANQIDSMKLILVDFEDITTEKDLGNKLNEHSKNLEATILTRTGQLAARVKELEDLNQSMVGREMKMIELKKEIAELKAKLNLDTEQKERKKKP